MDGFPHEGYPLNHRQLLQFCWAYKADDQRQDIYMLDIEKWQKWWWKGVTNQQAEMINST